MAIKWDRIYAETGQAISVCTTTDSNAITGAVVIMGRMWQILTLFNELDDGIILTDGVVIEVRVVLNIT